MSPSRGWNPSLAQRADLTMPAMAAQVNQARSVKTSGSSVDLKSTSLLEPEERKLTKWSPRQAWRDCRRESAPALSHSSIRTCLPPAQNVAAPYSCRHSIQGRCECYR
jgi:hypothetical protein